MEPSNINLIFAFRGSASVLAHAKPHCVTGITLPPVDATPFFSLSLWLCIQREDEEESEAFAFHLRCDS